MTIEAIDNIEIAYELAKKYSVEMPIVDSIYNILYNDLEPREAVLQLMTREAKIEDQNKNDKKGKNKRKDKIKEKIVYGIF